MNCGGCHADEIAKMVCFVVFILFVFCYSLVSFSDYF